MIKFIPLLFIFGCAQLNYMDSLYLNDLTYCINFNGYTNTQYNMLLDSVDLAIEKANMSIKERTGKGSVNLTDYACVNTISIGPLSSDKMGVNHIEYVPRVDGARLVSTKIVLSEGYIGALLIGHEEVYDYYVVHKIAILIMHEIGHGLGLGHVDNPKDIMYYKHSGEHKLRYDEIIYRKWRF